MTIKQLGGVFGRNPTFNDVTIDGELILNGEIFTGLDFQGSWNAAANTPTLASGVGTTGEFYIVSVAGTTNLDGITNWGVGDWAMFSGSAWQRVEGNADGNFVNLSVTGTATLNGLQVNNTATTGTNQEVASFRTASGGGLVIRSSDLSAANPDSILEPFFGESLKIKTSGNDRFKVADNGDISFYDTAGTSQSLFWDASAESLGIGTTTPSKILHISDTSSSCQIMLTSSNSATAGIIFGDSDDSATGHILYNHSDDALVFGGYNNTERMRIDDSGNVGIGTDLPVAKLHIENGDMRIEKDTKATIGFRGHTTGSTALAFRDSSAAVDRMTITASGNLLVGKTADLIANVGGTIGAAGYITATRDGAAPLSANRLNSDGALVNLYKDGGNPVGLIGTVGGDMYLGTTAGTTDNYIRFAYDTSHIIPASSAGAENDAAISLGHVNSRFVDLYLSGGAYLGGTGAANKLDDYEEGTFTPEIADASSGGNTGSATTVEGYYTKVGRLVTIAIALVDIDTTGMTSGNNLHVRGLPFSQGAGEDHGSARVNAVTFSGSLSTYCTGTYALVADSTSGTSFGYVSVGDCTSGSADIYMSFTYRTT